MGLLYQTPCTMMAVGSRSGYAIWYNRPETQCGHLFEDELETPKAYRIRSLKNIQSKQRIRQCNAMPSRYNSNTAAKPNTRNATTKSGLSRPKRLTTPASRIMRSSSTRKPSPCSRSRNWPTTIRLTSCRSWKWWDYMAEIMNTNPDNSPVVHPLREVFHLH